MREVFEKSPVQSKKFIALVVVEVLLGFIAWWSLQGVASAPTLSPDLVPVAQACIKYMGAGLLMFLSGQSTVDALVRRAKEKTEQLRGRDLLDPDTIQMPEALRRGASLPAGPGRDA